MIITPIITQQAPRSVRLYVDDETCDIEDWEYDIEIREGAFDLMGRSTEKTAKGIIIENGKKIYNKN